MHKITAVDHVQSTIV